MKKFFLILAILIYFTFAPWLNSLNQTKKNQIVQAAANDEKITFEDRSEIPNRYKWAINDIFKNTRDWKQTLTATEDLAKSFLKYKGKLHSSAKTFEKALDHYSKLMRSHDKVYVYANLAFDVNSTNSELQRLKDRAENMHLLVIEKTSWLQTEITKIPNEKLNNFLNKEELKIYKPFISSILKLKDHTLPNDLQQLLAKSSTMATVPESAYGMLFQEIQFPKIIDENGEKVRLTTSNFIPLLENKDRSIRKQAFTTYYKTLGNFDDTFAQLLNGEIKANNFYSEAQKYESALEGSLIPNQISPTIYSNLIDIVHENLPLLHRYMNIKKQMLGVKELHMYDIYTPTTKTTKNYIPFKDAKEIVINGLSVLGKEYTETLKKAFNERWIDVYHTPGKRGGAYQWGAYDTHPYILLNYNGTFDDIMTIAHELGHAMHSYYSNKHEPYITSHYETFTAEVASTLNEALLWEYLYKSANSKQEKIFLLTERLERFRSTLFRQTQFAEFEKKVHELQQKGESINASALKNIYLELNQKYYGSTMISDEEIGMEWARIPHFYRNFYVYQYATSMAASTALAKHISEQKKQAVLRIREKLLEEGSSKDPIQLLKDTGIDMSTKKPIKDAMEVFEQTLNELERMIKQ